MLEDALPLLIGRKDAFHLLLKQVSACLALTTTTTTTAATLPLPLPITIRARCQVEKAKPKLLQPALTDAMSHFAGESQEGLAPHSPKKARLSSVQHTADLSVRRLELKATPSSIPASFFWLKICSFVSRLPVRTSSRIAVAQSAMELLPDRWMKIWVLLITDPDDSVRNVARQARQILRDPAPEPRTICSALLALRGASCDATRRRFYMQAFASNPQRILAHAEWLVEQLETNAGDSWSTAKAEVLRLFATLQALPPLTVPSCAITVVSASSFTPTTLLHLLL